MPCLQGEAIAHNLRTMFGLKVPIISIVIGEGGSGGALVIGCANKLLMLENAVFYIEITLCYSLASAVFLKIYYQVQALGALLGPGREKHFSKRQASHGFLARNAIVTTTHHLHASTSTSSSGGDIVIISSNNCSTTNRSRFEESTIAAPPTEADLKNVDCMNRCGNLNIPYPFGVKENCYRSEDFFINCSDSQPYLRHSDITISNISLEEGELRIMNYISRNCYDRLGTPLQSNFYGWLVATNFSISSTKNKFTSIGCDTYGFLHILVNESLVFTTGCVSSCMSNSYVPDDGSCSRIGCCQTSIPKRLSHIENDAHSFNNHTDVLDFNPCSYAFVVEEAAFNFSTTYLQDFKETKVPLVLDWGIGDNKTCDEAKRNLTSYACGDNSDCYEAEIDNMCVSLIDGGGAIGTNGASNPKL
ncbi:hypothetical protein TEA_010299 [Camellia sinensis var. sinensis]|uniref:acetyl-CoA carboxytransferase n=1 Tax=Camellia sinensis var. sinensis TaxID=542762 RepID=A0A4S4D912_CAMSN|nr:hypothetical protein TEA_010299 [Camellia sinensis var. sinensis]